MMTVIHCPTVNWTLLLLSASKAEIFANIIIVVLHKCLLKEMLTLICSLNLIWTEMLIFIRLFVSLPAGCSYPT